MNQLKLLEGIPESMRDEFHRFVQTGEASDAFLTYLDKDAHAQAAVEEAFNDQAKALEGLARMIKDEALPAEHSQPDPASQVVGLVERIVEFDDSMSRSGVLRDVAASLVRKGGQEGARRAQSTLLKLERAVGSMVK